MDGSENRKDVQVESTKSAGQNLAAEAVAEKTIAAPKSQAEKEKVLEPDIPADLSKNTPESARKYNLEIGTQIVDNLRSTDRQSALRQGDEAARPLDKELQSLSNEELAARLERDLKDPKVREQLEKNWKPTAEEQLMKTKMVSDLYRVLTRTGASAAENELAKELKDNMNNSSKRVELLENFQDKIVDRYFGLLSDKSNPAYNKTVAEWAKDWKADWTDPSRRDALFAKQGSDWPGKERNCCCDSDRNKAMGMISWIEKGQRAQNAQCHGTNLIHYFPAKSLRFD
jgi:hypothetical protein